MIKLAVFDMDGTILDTLRDLAVASNYALEHHGYPKQDPEEYRYFVGNGVHVLIRRIMPEGATETEQATVLETYRSYYGQHRTDFTKPYPGITEALRRLAEAGIVLAVLSNKPHEPTQMLAEHYFPGVFAAVYGGRPEVPGKPDPAALFALMEELGAKPEETAFIGDSDVDMQVAKNAGARAVGAVWGYRSREELSGHGADLLVEFPAELPALLLGE